MRLSIFSRLILGYLFIFVLVLGVSAYALFQLRRFDEVARSILATDTRVLDYEKKLTDTLLSQIRYERKFTITKDDALFKQFLQFKDDFDRYLEQALSVGDRRDMRILTTIQQDYHRYQEVFIKEAQLIKAGRSYPEAFYKEEKDKITGGILGSLEKLSIEREQETYNKVKKLAESGMHAGEVARVITAGSLIFLVVVSFLLTRSITRPISLLKEKTREIANGRFEGNLRVSSPPEIGELAMAFNTMCQRLHELERMKTEFFSSMSHELRTPLTSIKEGTGLLLDGVGGTTTEKQKRLLTIVAEESNRLIGLVNSLLDLSKMEAGMMTYNFQRSSLTPLINKAVTEIIPLVEARAIRLETEIGEDLPPVLLDQERILQALRNLIGNAVKFTPRAGRVKIAARSVDGNVEFSVRDTGPGIATENLTAIFEKFHQAPGAAASMNGTGLGLAIAKHIIVSHGGTIWAENHPEQGSTFFFVLPF
ncbi:MAG TPA: ATP-binding protein [Candidatus Binatia bacterium]|nr:ATP-binding protein [Candidatus Binatia bacterium]